MYGIMPQLDFLVCYMNVGHSKFGYRNLFNSYHLT